MNTKKYFWFIIRSKTSHCKLAIIWSFHSEWITSLCWAEKQDPQTHWWFLYWCVVWSHHRDWISFFMSQWPFPVLMKWLKTNKYLSSPVSLQIMPVTYELNFLSKHIFIGGTFSSLHAQCHRCWSLIKNVITSVSWSRNYLTVQRNENRKSKKLLM